MLRLFSLLALTAVTTAAQPVVSLRVGLDANEVPGLNDWQRADLVALNERSIAVVETDSFPSYASIQASAGLQMSSRQRVTAHLGYGSTSGRLDYSDYSGSARADRRAQRVFGGVSGEQAFVEVGPASLWALASGRVSRVSVAYDREIQVGAEVVEAVSETYTAWPISVEGALALELAAGATAFVRLQGGWELGFGGALSGPFDPGVSATWDGYRLGASVGARF